MVVNFALLIAVVALIASVFMLRMAALVVVIMMSCMDHTCRHTREDAEC